MKNKFIFPSIVTILFLSLLPARSQIFLEAEDYIAQSGIAVEGCDDYGGGQNVGWIDTDDWMEYDIHIPMSGKYICNFRFASLNGECVLTLIEDGESLGDVQIPATGGWQNWQFNESDTISLEQGLNKIRLTATSGGYNLNWFEFRLVLPEDNDIPATPEIVQSTSGVHDISIIWNKVSDTTTMLSGYKIYKNDQFFAFSDDTSFHLTKIAPETEYDLQVVACDLAGNQSLPNSLVISTTPIPWILSWHDEFDGTEVDRSKWNFEVGGDGWGNGEAQYYTDGGNSSINDGCLVIEARKESIGNNQFTSSRMNNGGKGSFLYGRVEIRAKLPSTGGTWPAIWTLPTEWVYGSWPNCGEIDIMEHRGNYLNYVFGTIHTGAYNHTDGTAQSGGRFFEDVVNTFHTYTLEWYPDHLDWYYDDELVFTFNNEYKTFAEWPYDIRHHIMLNVAIGGGLGGEIDHNGTWPQQMIVDYVRIYDFNIGAGDTIAPTVPKNLNANVSGINVDLSWDISTDNEFVDKYFIYLNDVLVDSVSGSIVSLKYLEPMTDYRFGVEAQDFGGNTSERVFIDVRTGEINSFEVPGKFEAEDYLYMEGMQLENCTDEGGGKNMAYIDEGDWLEYSIDVSSAGKYYLVSRAASLTSLGLFQLLNQEQDDLCTVQTPVTGGWQNWGTVVSEGFYLDQGIQRIKVLSMANEFNLNWFAITADSAEYIADFVDHFTPNVLVYPNPFSGEELSIYTGRTRQPVIIKIITIDGRIMYSREIQNADDLIFLRKLGLPPGFFLLNIRSGTLIASHKIRVF
jgi:beta-glucanase (GH16 family)